MAAPAPRDATGDEPLDVLAGLDDEREREAQRSRRAAGMRAAAVVVVVAEARPWGGRVAMVVGRKGAREKERNGERSERAKRRKEKKEQAAPFLHKKRRETTKSNQRLPVDAIAPPSVLVNAQIDRRESLSLSRGVIAPGSEPRGSCGEGGTEVA